MITEEKITTNYSLFKKALEQSNIDTSKFDEYFGDKLKRATFAINNDEGTAYDGSLIEILLRTLTPYGVKINELLPNNLQMPKESVVKVCLLHQISKAFMFEKNDNQWEIEKRGMLYKYTPSKVALKMGGKSLFIIQDLGIKLTENELEAIANIDRINDDPQTKFYSSSLATVLKQANDLTHLTLRK